MPDTKKKPISKTRKNYILRLVGRIMIFLACLGIYFLRPQELTILQGMNFFQKPSVFHILWGIWLIDMLFQLIPIKNRLPLGSMKLFKERFRPLHGKINYQALRQYITATTKSAYKVFILWLLLLAVIGTLYYTKILNGSHLFLISVAFYVCDLICVLIWCPFRLIMKNKCCTTCRIFNWDHLMMFTPMIFILGFYSATLILFALAAWLLWELCVLIYPERFWEHSNASLKCSECTDKLCTQYCQKLRKK